MREADAMENIRRCLYENNKRGPVLVTRVIRDMVTRYVMAPHFLSLPIMMHLMVFPCQIHAPFICGAVNLLI